MYKKTKLIMLFILIGTILSSCNNKNDNNSNINSVTQGSIQQKSSNSSNLSPDTVIVTVGNEKITYSEALIYMLSLKDDYEESLGSEIWSYELMEGYTFADYAKEDIMSQMIQLKIVGTKASELGIELTDDELQEISDTADEYLSGITDEDIEKYGLTKEIVEKVYKDNYISDKIFEISTSEVDTNVSDKEAKMITVYSLCIMKSELGEDGNYYNYTDEQIKEKFEYAKDLRKQAKKMTAEEFYDFAEENSEDEEIEITFGRDEMLDEYEKAAFALKTGELSKVVDTSEAYFIIYCVDDNNEDATYENKEAIIEQRQDEIFEEKYNEWSKGVDIDINDEVWNKLSFVNEDEVKSQDDEQENIDNTDSKTNSEETKSN